MIRLGVIYKNRKRHRYEVRCGSCIFQLPTSARVGAEEIVRVETPSKPGTPCRLVQSKYHNLPVFKVWICVYDCTGAEAKELASEHAYTGSFLSEASGCRMLNALSGAAFRMRGNVDSEFERAATGGYEVRFELEKSEERHGRYEIVSKPPRLLAYTKVEDAQQMATWLHEHGLTIFKKLSERLTT